MTPGFGSQLQVFPELCSLEICAGAGGQALGLEAAGFTHLAAVEIDDACITTLRHNRPAWNPIQQDIRSLDGRDFRGIDLLAGGVPCPPFSIAGKQLGANDERDLFPAALDLIADARPRAVLLENVKGLGSPRFAAYREQIEETLIRLGYHKPWWDLLNACNFGVPQLRPRFVLVTVLRKYAEHFEWPRPAGSPATVGETLLDLMRARGWPGATQWAEKADGIAPTLVGGSKKHGGPDLGPTRAKSQWRLMGVDGHGVADEAPGPDFPRNGAPKLTVQMAARLQGFPDDWIITGRKTAAYRQVGNAFPPPVAEALGNAVRDALLGIRSCNTGSIAKASGVMSSKRQLLREAVVVAIQAEGSPLHNTQIAALVLPKLNLQDKMTAKDVNTTLHDDPQRRFRRVGRGIWNLAS